MEDQNHPRLAQCLEPEGEHPGLNGNRGESQEVIAVERGIVGVEQVRPQQQPQQQAAKQASPALLEAEQQELVEPKAPAGAGVECFEQHIGAALRHRADHAAHAAAGVEQRHRGDPHAAVGHTHAVGGVGAGVGQAVAVLTETYLAVDHKLIAVATYAIAMALFTIIMGNAFAAFPVITAGIGIPLLVLQHGGDPAIMAAIGMFCGYCGTLLTPMAANFNIVPAALLELPDKNAVIKAQAPTALVLLGVNIVLMYLLMF